MSYGIMCRQDGCRAYAAYRYTWPGKPESFICESHKLNAERIAAAIGMPLEFKMLTPGDHSGPEGMKSLEDQGK
jgi:hypothetical protein